MLLSHNKLILISHGKKFGFYSKYNWKAFEILSKTVMRSNTCLNDHFAVYTIDYEEEKREKSRDLL